MRRRPLLGRTSELSEIDASLVPAGASTVIRISGPVGIGKSALLQRAMVSCIERALPLRRLDPVNERVDGDHIRAAFDELAREPASRRVLVIDDLHLARDAERWLAANLHLLPPSTTILLGDRQRTPLAWFGAAATPIELALEPLDDLAVSQVLDAYGVQPATREAGARLAEGNPLVLTFFAERDRRVPLQIDDALLGLACQLFADYDESARIAGLSVLAVAAAAPSELFERAIPDEIRARDVVRWLRSLSVVENTREGLALHPAARLACATLVRTHHPAIHQEIVDVLGPKDTVVKALADGGRETPIALRAEVAAAAPVPVSSVGASVIVSSWRTGAAVSVADAAPQFSELLRERLDDLARQAALTDREREVFELLVLGRSANEMATVLGITTRTVKFHQQRVLEKIGADSRLDILRLLL